MYIENKQVWTVEPLIFLGIMLYSTNQREKYYAGLCDDSCLRSFYGTIPSKYEKPKTFSYRKNVFIATAII